MKTFKNKPITLVGKELQVGDIAPNFKAMNNHLEEVSLSDFKNEYIVINVVPSLDTPVCDLQTKTVNNELLSVTNIDIKVLTLSNDLPFAQAKWVINEEFEGIVALSDYLYHDFGTKYGLLIKELNLLARELFVLNAKREIIFKLETNEMTQHLDYEKLIKFIHTLSGK